MRILVDTGAWYALADTSDAHHAAAVACYDRHYQADELVTTVPIVAETFTLLTAHLGHHAAHTWWQTFRETGIRCLLTTGEDLARASQILDRFQDQDFSLTDCLTFSLMDRLGIETVFSFDHHFLIVRVGPESNRSFRRVPS